ncbi:Deoxycytidine monophosphate (dCMP) deaminase, variant 2 [Orbilia oligospora]|nr:Deoxycytidine monophosphate (dCMP) deaminase, variant 2 [Orbilia oligospora]KAF3186566.1 Deoxycytidine monophosphate (dCMP) deaminase, variant 2 [Orbilia oligospora]KAF3261983.1 Deoxycytidine monophosphate (dCMP) deaminase, variant 2 [Orbilia oligospora]KAF3266041.1 Deoxycytidine monophosphate (dCMP) deaminase, variant 2 [Orbilia oligospora]KAF3296715.1 Deoxycytidine monophosphate (dCMP) deaminase, variant 2 [Orbilia oligospora]
MFIGLCGTICAGKHTVAKFLVETYGFQILRLAAPTTTSIAKEDGSSTTDTVVTSFPGNGNLTFPTVEELLDYVTERWQEKFVTTDVLNEEMLDILLKRPFFILVSVDAPIVVRWKRYIEKCKTYNPPLLTPTLETFVQKADKHMFDPQTGLIPLFVRATLHLLNSFTSIDTFYENLRSIDLVDETRLRPTWDAYFMQLANLAAQRSNCMKRRVGCVLVREKRVISTGYNGTPRGLTNCNDGGCMYHYLLTR